VKVTDPQANHGLRTGSFDYAPSMPSDEAHVDCFASAAWADRAARLRSK